MKVNLHTQVEEAQIQIIPLIDVVFCILTFFLLAALQFTRQQAINVDLPKASTNTAASINAPGASQIVTIDALGNVYIEKQQVRREELAQKVKDYLQANPNATLVLNASRTATYNDVIETLDLLRQVGGDRVFLGIIPTSAQPTPNVPNLSAPPNFPLAPGTAPIPQINPNQPPTEQGISPQVPTNNAPAPQAPASQPVAPENSN